MHLRTCMWATTGGKNKLYCIVLYLLPLLNAKSYDGAQVLEASGRPMLVIGRSYWVGPIQEEDEETGMVTDGTTKLTEEIMEWSVEGPGKTGITAAVLTGTTGVGLTGTKSIAYRGGNSAGKKTGAFGTGL